MTHSIEPSDLNQDLPPETRKAFQGIWDNLSPAEKQALQSLIKGIPSDVNLMKMLLRLSAQHFRMAFGKKHRVAIVGPTNVGKSTLYNQLVLNRSDWAEVSPLPGTTRVVKESEADLFHVIDTPGADALGAIGDLEREEALNAAKDADFLIILFDAIQGIKRSELELFNQLSNLGKPYMVAINKIDLVRRQSESVVRSAAQNLGLQPAQVIPIAAKTGQNLHQILISIAVNEPELVAALGQAMPQYRWRLAWRAIVSAASISTVIALTPLPVVDFAPLVVTQSVMVLGIARIYNYQITLARARELVVTFGLGFLGRTLFYELSKFGGVPGWLLSAAIASSTTIVMGYAASIWFEKGEKVSTETLKAMTAATTRHLLAQLPGRIKKTSGKRDLRQEIVLALENSQLGEDRTLLEKQPENNNTLENN